MPTFGLGQASPPTAADTTVPIDASTPWMAASEGNLPLLQHALTTLGLPVTAVDENGYSLLQAAASYSQTSVLEWLLQQPGISINAVDHEGDSALHYADQVSAAQLLIQAGIDAQIRNAAGQTALESKQHELHEMLQDEDTEDDDPDLIHLRGLVDYLSNLTMMAQ